MFNQNGTDYPLVAGVYSTRSKALLAFEADEDTIFDKVMTGLDCPVPPTMVSGSAPCHDEVITADDIDIRRWPIRSLPARLPDRAPLAAAGRGRGAAAALEDRVCGFRNLFLAFRR